MILVHLADVHIGLSKYGKMNRDGRNRREIDIEATFARAMNRIIALAPHVIVIGGDLFDSPRPTNAAVIFTYAQFAKLVAALPDCIIVWANGNHELDKVTTVAPIAELFTHLGIYIATRESQRFYFPERDLSILAVPDAPGVERPMLVPDARASINICVCHGEVQGMPRKGGVPTNEISTEEMGPQRWTYVAMGHWHVCKEIQPNVWYPGSLDYVSSDIWGELVEERALGLSGKGFLVRDLTTGAQSFVALPASRPVIDLPALSAIDLTAEQLDAAIRELLAPVPDDAIVRLIVHDVEKHVERALPKKALQRRFLHLNLDCKRPAPVECAADLSGDDILRERRKSVYVRWDDQIDTRKAAGSIAADVDPEAVRALGRKYIELASSDDSSSDTLNQSLHDSINQPLQRSA